MLRRIVTVVLVLAVVGFSTCVVFAAEEKVKTDICANLYATDIFEYWLSWNRGSKEAAEALGLKYVAYSENFEGLEKSLANVEDAIGYGAKGISFVASNQGAIVPVSKMCTEKKVFLTNTWNSVPWFSPLDGGDYYLGFFTPDNIELGYLSAIALFEEMGGKGNVVEISGFPGSGSAEDRSLGVKIAMKEYPGIKLLDSQPSHYRRDQARKVMEDFLVAYPQIDGVMACNDDSAIGAIGAFKERGMKIPKMVGHDGIKEALELVRTGELTATFLNYPEWQGGYPMVILFDAINGWRPSVPERMMYTGGKILNRSNVDEYYNKVIGTDKTPFDWRKMSKTLYPDDWDPQVQMSPMDPNAVWKYFERPKGYKLPAAYAEAWAKGEFTRVEDLYRDHAKNLIVR